LSTKLIIIVNPYYACKLQIEWVLFFFTTTYMHQGRFCTNMSGFVATRYKQIFHVSITWFVLVEKCQFKRIISKLCCSVTCL